MTLDTLELPAGEKAVLSLQLPKEFVIVFEPVTHSAQFIDVQGEPTKERQQLSLVYNKTPTPTGGTRTMRPGPLRLSLDNQADVRVLPSVFIAGDAMHHLIGKRKPFLTAKRMLSNQTFRDVFKADNLNVDQRLKITSLTFLFTDLKGSTALYERVGDLAAFDLVRAHFHALLEIISSEKGAVVKTIGDAVMATFIRPEHAIVAGLRMRAAMDALNAERGTEDLVVKIGIHEGPCLAVMLNERQDYFGQTVNIAARVQSLSTSQEIHITGAGDRCAGGCRDSREGRRSGRSRSKPRCAASPTRWWCTRYPDDCLIVMHAAGNRCGLRPLIFDPYIGLGRRVRRTGSRDFGRKFDAGRTTPIHCRRCFSHRARGSGV